MGVAFHVSTVRCAIGGPELHPAHRPVPRRQRVGGSSRSAVGITQRPRGCGSPGTPRRSFGGAPAAPRPEARGSRHPLLWPRAARRPHVVAAHGLRARRRRCQTADLRTCATGRSGAGGRGKPRRSPGGPGPVPLPPTGSAESRPLPFAAPQRYNHPDAWSAPVHTVLRAKSLIASLPHPSSLNGSLIVRRLHSEWSQDEAGPPGFRPLFEAGNPRTPWDAFRSGSLLRC